MELEPRKRGIGVGEMISDAQRGGLDLGNFVLSAINDGGVKRAIREAREKRRIIGAVPLLLFPKPFEMFSFLASVDQQQDTWINDATLDNVKLYSLTFKEQITGNEIKMYVHSLDSSDIDFSFKLGRFIKDFKAENEDLSLHITLAGTCGGSAKWGRKIGEAFRITKAIKFDRGSIKMGDRDLILDLNKSNMSLTCTSTNISWGETILSCNHVVCIDPADLAVILKLSESECTLCDMETFEFFSTCYFMDVTRFDCIRVVSDVFKPGSDRDTERLIRKHVNMNSILNLLVQQSFELAQEREYETYKIPSLPCQQNHHYLVHRMKENIHKLRLDLILAYRLKGHKDFRIEDLMSESVPATAIVGTQAGEANAVASIVASKGNAATSSGEVSDK